MSLISSAVTRVSTAAMREQMMAQLQTGQSSLIAIQRQLATGERLLVPSDDLPAATRGMQLQRLVEQKSQMAINLRETTAFLDVTDAALSDSGGMLAQARGLAVKAVDSTTSNEERDAIALELQSILGQFLQVANKKFQGRYLFSGSDPTIVPYVDQGGKIAFRGNEQSLRTFADFDLLVDTNLSGADVFGGLSEQVRPDVDFNPVLTSTTPLSALRAGEGVQLSSLKIADGVNTSIVDLSSAATVGDVARLLVEGAPAGRELTVDITAAGLSLQLDAAGGGNLTVSEVDGGTTAAQLGIRNTAGTGTAPLVGSDLNPRLDLTTRVDDFLGVRSRTLLRSPGPHNDIAIEANTVGTAADGYAVQVVNDGLLQAAPGLNPGNEYVQFEPAPVAARAALTLSGVNNDLVLTAASTGTAANGVRIEIVAAPLGGDLAQASYDAVNKRLTLTIDDADQTTLGTLEAAIYSQGLFLPAPDNSLGEGYDPAQIVSAADAGVVSGYTGNSGSNGNTFFVHVSPLGSKAEDVVAALNSEPTFNAVFSADLAEFDSSNPTLSGSGIVDSDSLALTDGGSGEPLDPAGFSIVQGSEQFTVSLAGVATVGDLLNAIRDSGADVLAEINASGTAIDVRSRVSGVDFSIGENGGQTATQLGLRSFTASTALSELNYGRGVETFAGPDLVIHRRDGTELQIDLSGALTIGDVLDLINNDPGNLDPATRVEARLIAVGNGIEIVDANAAGPDTLEVRRARPSQAAWDLGLVPKGQDSVTATAGAIESIQGEDVRPLEVQSVFNTLIRLGNAVRDGDVTQIERLAGLLNEDLDRSSLERASIGARAQTVDALTTRLEDEQVEIQQILSEKLDVDFADAISRMTAQQIAVQATMEMIGRTFQLTLLDFI